LFKSESEGVVSVVKVQVIDKETGKLRWEENHSTREAANKAIKEMKVNWFNPDYFKFLIKP
jgi:hypothetical protein